MISRVTRVVRRGIIPKLRAPRPGSKDYGGSGRGQLESRNSCEPSVTTLILARCPRMGGIVAEDLLEKSERGVNQWEKRGKGERGKGKRGRERGKKKSILCRGNHGDYCASTVFPRSGTPLKSRVVH